MIYETTCFAIVQDPLILLHKGQTLLSQNSLTGKLYYLYTKIAVEIFKPRRVLFSELRGLFVLYQLRVLGKHVGMVLTHISLLGNHLFE